MNRLYVNIFVFLHLQATVRLLYMVKFNTWHNAFFIIA